MPPTDPDVEALRILNNQAIGLPAPAGMPPKVLPGKNPLRRNIKDDQLMKLAKTEILRVLTPREIELGKKKSK